MNKSPKIFFFALILTLILPCPAFAHSGKTDSNGGHHDYNNISDLGSYHYHCNGNPAHLHTDGICPYSSNTLSPSLATLPAEETYNSLNHNSVKKESSQYIIETDATYKRNSENTDVNNPGTFKSSIFNHKEVLACIFFVTVYIIALLYRIFISRELYTFPFALSVLSLVWMFVSLYCKDIVMLFVSGICAVINLFCEK